MSLLVYLRTRLLLLGLMVSLPIVYLVFSLYELGLDDATEGYLKEDSLYAQSVLNTTGVLPQSTDFRFYYLGEDTLPDHFKIAVKNKRYSPYYIWQTDEAVFYGVKETTGNNSLYVFHKFYLEEAIPGIQLETIVLGLMGAIILLMLLGAALIYQRISKAMAYLNEVSNNPIDAGINDSEFAEINKIAAALKSSVTELNQKNIHERYFIQSLSHELRTPMAIIQVAVELLKKNTNLSDDERLSNKLTSIYNANLKMQSLSNNLLSLWGARDQQETSQVCLNTIITQSVDELAQYYDIKGRIRLCLPSEGVMVNISLFAAQLVVFNIIKNAIVHGEGAIDISLKNKHILITNQIALANNSSDSVGMGLFIVGRGVECLGWQYQITKDEIYTVEIQFSE